jgi:hypothetical protein
MRENTATDVQYPYSAHTKELDWGNRRLLQTAAQNP